MASVRAGQRKRALSLAQNLLGLAILAWFGRYLWEHRDYFESALDVSVFQLAALAALIVISWALTSAQSAVLYRALGAKIGFKENFLLTLGATFGGYLPMLAGTAVRFHYMKRIHGVRYAHSGGISWLRMLLVMLSTALFGVTGTLALALGGNGLSIPLLALFTILLVLPLAAIVWPPKRHWVARLPAPGPRIMGDFIDSLTLLRRDRRDALWVFVLVVLQQVCLALRFATAASAIGQSPSFLLLGIQAALAVFVSFISITPAALGLREAVMGYVTYATGASFGTGLFVGAVDRAVLLAMVTVFGGSSLGYLWARLRRAEATQPEAAH